MAKQTEKVSRAPKEGVKENFKHGFMYLDHFLEVSSILSINKLLFQMNAL